MNQHLELKFISYNLKSYVSAFLNRIQQGNTAVLLRPFNQLAADFVSEISHHEKSADVKFYVNKSECELPLPDNAEFFNNDKHQIDVIILFIADARSLSAHLFEYLELKHGIIIAPITPHYYENTPLFLISIPKSGTHLLYKLAESFGYKPGIVLSEPPSPGNWYCLEYSNSHTSAKDFFIDTVRRSPFGNRHHPFPRSPAIFIYRNPLDILVSEANYYHKDGKTAFHGYLNTRSFEERLLTLIDDPWLMGSIRDRIGNFIPWLEFGNVIPISFEELIGDQGGASGEEQLKLIWSMQLKLHIPGNPKYFGKKIFDQNSPTFHKGKIGSFKDYFTDEAYKKFYQLPQDFVQSLGYDFEDPQADNLVPKRSLEFRARPLTYSEVDFDNTQILVERQYLGHSIYRFASTYYAVPEFLRLPLANQANLTLKLFISDNNLIGLKHKISKRAKISLVAWNFFWQVYFGVQIYIKRLRKR